MYAVVREVKVIPEVSITVTAEAVLADISGVGYISGRFNND